MSMKTLKIHISGLWTLFFYHLGNCCSNFTDENSVPNPLFIYMCFKFYLQAVLQADTLHLGRIVTWLCIWINVVECKTGAKFIEDFLLWKEKIAESKDILKLTWTLAQTSPVSWLFLVKLHSPSTCCSDISSAVLVMAHRVTAGYTTDSIGIWATEVEVGVSAQSLKKVLEVTMNNTYVLHHSKDRW